MTWCPRTCAVQYDLNHVLWELHTDGTSGYKTTVFVQNWQGILYYKYISFFTQYILIKVCPSSSLPRSSSPSPNSVPPSSTSLGKNKHQNRTKQRKRQMRKRNEHKKHIHMWSHMWTHTYMHTHTCMHTYTHGYIEAKPIKNTKSETITYKQESNKKEKISKSVSVFILSCLCAAEHKAGP